MKIRYVPIASRKKGRTKSKAPKKVFSGLELMGLAVLGSLVGSFVVTPVFFFFGGSAALAAMLAKPSYDKFRESRRQRKRLKASDPLTIGDPTHNMRGFPAVLADGAAIVGPHGTSLSAELTNWPRGLEFSLEVSSEGTAIANPPHQSPWLALPSCRSKISALVAGSSIVIVEGTLRATSPVRKCRHLASAVAALAAAPSTLARSVSSRFPTLGGDESDLDETLATWSSQGIAFAAWLDISPAALTVEARSATEWTNAQLQYVLDASAEQNLEYLIDPRFHDNVLLFSLPLDSEAFPEPITTIACEALLTAAPPKEGVFR